MSDEEPISSTMQEEFSAEVKAQWELEHWWVTTRATQARAKNQALREGGRPLSDKLLQRLVIRVAESVAFKLEEDVAQLDSSEGRGAVRTSIRLYSQLLESMEPFELAYTVLARAVTILLTTPQPVPLASLGHRILDALEEELRLRVMVKLDPELPDLVRRVLKDSRATLTHRRKTFNLLFHKRVNYRIPQFLEDDTLRSQTAAALLELLFHPKATNLFLFKKYFDPKVQGMRYGMYLAETATDIFNREKDLSWLAATTRPLGITLFPPGKKNITETGPGVMMLTREVKPVVMSPLRGKHRGDLVTALDNGLGVDKFQKALFRLENTPLKINTTMLAWVQKHQETLRGMGVLVDSSLKLPPYPFQTRTSEPTSDHDKQKLSDYKSAATKAHNKYWRALVKFSKEVETLELATKLSTHDRFYLQHYGDFRGRLYSVNNSLSFQGTSLAKCLLEFAEPKQFKLEVGDPAFRSLVLYGLRLISPYAKRGSSELLEKFDWMSSGVIHWLEGFLDTPDKALQVVSNKDYLPFIAWCHEMLRLTSHTWGSTVSSAHPIRRDATCSSIQHMAAMSGDTKVMAMVNCIKPQGDGAAGVRDIYTEIIPDLDRRGLQRDWVKTFVMTLAYQSTERTRKKGLRESYKEHFGQELGYEAATELSKDIRESAEAALGKVIDLQRWLLKVFTQLVTRDGVHALSKTPTSWIVDSTKYHVPTAVYRVLTYDATVRVVMATEMPEEADDDSIDLRASRRGWVANIIHSLDAALIHQALSSLNIPIQTIHDCVVARPGEILVAHEALREAFASMYSPNEASGLPHAVHILSKWWGLKESYPSLYAEAKELFQAAPETAFESLPYFFV